MVWWISKKKEKVKQGDICMKSPDSESGIDDMKNFNNAGCAMRAQYGFWFTGFVE